MPQRTTTEYHHEFLNSVRASATVENTFTEVAFVNEASRRLTEAEEVDSLVQGHFEGSGVNGRKIGFDGYDFGDDEGQIVLAVSHFVNGDEPQTLIDTEAKRLVAKVVSFIEAALGPVLIDSLEESSVGYQVARQLRDTFPGVHKVRVYLLTNAVLSTRVKEFPAHNIGSVTIEFHPWDIARFQRVEESTLGREEIDINLLEWAPEGIPCLKAAISASSVDTYLAAIPGSVLAGVYRRYGSRVLESNVRSFLSVRGNVNKGIRGTLLSQPEMFLSFNNGITATATEVKTERIDGEIRLTGLKDLQIVNGGQTTASIFYSDRDDKDVDLSDVFVQMKLIIVTEIDEAEIVPKISRFANTQNRINDADFFSNHKFHQRMEEKSRRILAPAIAGSPFQTKWFYERTRGQFSTDRSRLGAAAARQFEVEFPKSQLVTKTDAARYIVSWSQLPHIVSSGAQKNFIQFAKEIDAQWEKGDAGFNDDYYRHMIAKGILFNGIRTRVLKADWYRQSPGYLANIVTYTVAKLVNLVESRPSSGEFDLDRLWASQSLPDDLWEALEPIAIAMRDVLTDHSRPVINVTEWAKREKAWDAARSLIVPVSPTMNQYLVAKEDRAGAVRDAKLDQKMLDGIEAQILVNKLGSRYWYEMRDFGRRLNGISQKESSILSIAIGETGRMVSEAQAKVLVQLEQRMVGSGFTAK